MIPQKQRRCKYCQYLHLVAKVMNEPTPIEIRPTQECRIFKVSLCNNHKDLFHAR